MKEVMTSKLPSLLQAHLLFCQRSTYLKKAKEPASKRTGTVQT